MRAVVSRIARQLVAPALSIALALLIGVAFILLSGENVVDAYSRLIFGPLHGYNFTSMLTRAIPLLLTGLCATVSFRSGLLNIGGEGQLHLGAMAAVCVALYAKGLPPVIHVFLCLAAAAIAGGLWAVVPAVLKAQYRMNELFSTLMFNYIGILFTTYLATYPLRDPGPEGFVAQTMTIPQALVLARLGSTRLHVGAFIALAAVPVTYYVLWKMVSGYEMRMSGLNATFAEYGGVNQKAVVVRTMIMSGMLAGLAGGIEILGVHKRFIVNFSPGYGFDGVVVAILGGLHPLGVLVSSLLMSVLKTGAMVMERGTDVPLQLVSVIQAIIIFFITGKALGARSLGSRERGDEQNA